MKKLLIAVLLLMGTSSAYAVTFDWERQHIELTTGNFNWWANYDIGFYNNTLMIDLDVRNTNNAYAPNPALLSRWETGIESIWSTNRFEVPISFNFDWVTSGQDQYIIVLPGTARWNMNMWYTGVSGWGDAYQEKAAAHEFGHMVGMWDEYAGGAVNPVEPMYTGGLMGSLYGLTLDYYYTPFLDWYGVKMAELDVPTGNGTSVPEPPVILLLGSGLIGLIGFRRKFRK